MAETETAPATETPAAATTAAPPATPAATPPAAATAPKSEPAKGKRDFVRIPRNEWGKRLKSEASKEIQKVFGMSVEDVQKILADKKASPTDQPAVSAKLEADVQKLRKELDAAQRRAVEAETKGKKALERAKDAKLDLQLKLEAASAGVQDTDYAATLYAREVRSALAAGKKEMPNSKAFFGALKETHPLLFTSAPAPKAAEPATTAPPESPAPGEEKPKPATAGTPPAQANVDDMTTEQFKEYQRRTYGFAG